MVAVLAKKFNQASNCVTQVGLSDLCRYAQDGTDAGAAGAVFPYRVDMVPQYKGRMPATPSSLDTLMRHLNDIPQGTPLYTMFAYDSPQDYAAGKGRRLGDMVTTTNCTTSAFGDAHLFIRHQRVEEDWALRPEWLPHLNPERDCSAKTIDPTPPKKCSNTQVAAEV